MKNKIIDKLYNFILSNKECSDKQKKIYKYGLEGLYNLLTKTIVIFISCLLIKTLKEFALLLIFYSLLRLYAFGIHANNSISCWIVTLATYIGGSLIIKIITIPNNFAYLIWAIGIISFILWAPADTPKRPLIRGKQRKRQKIQATIILFIYILFIIYGNRIITNAICLSIIIESICVNPLTYLLTKTTFNNYKYYKKGLNNN